jgi:hypothetical protein
MTISIEQSFSQKGFLAIKQPQFKKIEAAVRGGLAVAAQRTEMISVPLIMSYELNGKTINPREHEIILRGDSGLASWAKQIYVFGEAEFVLCPESAVIGIATKAFTLKVSKPE